MNLSCKRCGRAIPSQNIHIDGLIAKCDGCSAVFGLAEDVPGAAAPRRRARRGNVPLPSGISAEDTGTALVITRRWWSAIYIFVAVFCVFWCGFLVFWCAMAARRSCSSCSR